MKALLITTSLLAILFLFPILGTFFGSITGWCVESFYPHTSSKFLVKLGFGEFKMWEIGAALGFVGGFIRPTIRQTKED